MGYKRELEWNEPPSRVRAPVRAVDRRARGRRPGRVVVAAGAHRRGRSRTSRRPGSERDAPVAVRRRRLVAAKRGRRGGGDYAGVDGDVQTGALRADATAADAAGAPVSAACRRRAIGSDAIRVAVIDVAFDELAALPAPAEGPIRVGLPGDDATSRADAPAIGPGHGTAMAGVVLAVCPGAHVGLFQIAGVGGAARPYLAPVDLAAAVAAAVGGWQADVVLIAMSDGAWGTPRYLRDVLREAARRGRRRAGHVDLLLGRRSVAQPRPPGRQRRAGRRRSRQPALGARDRGVRQRAARWYRVYPGYDAPGRAPGERRRRDLQPPGPGGRAGGAGRAAPLERAHRRRRLQPGHRLAAAAAARVLARRTASSPPRSCARCWR